uniref:Uncharacterized protein n=1 Tax=Glossina palpalis gambiensis TaxID=67801 RepID=A0A1B0ANV2_9MUSC
MNVITAMTSINCNKNSTYEYEICSNCPFISGLRICLSIRLTVLTDVYLPFSSAVEHALTRLALCNCMKLLKRMFRIIQQPVPIRTNDKQRAREVFSYCSRFDRFQRNDLSEAYVCIFGHKGHKTEQKKQSFRCTRAMQRHDYTRANSSNTAAMHENTLNCFQRQFLQRMRTPNSYRQL